MTNPPAVYHYSSLTEPLDNEELLSLGMGFLPTLLDAIQNKWTAQKPNAPVRRIYGTINGNKTFTITIETSFINKVLGKELEFSVAYTPYASKYYETEPVQNFTRELFLQYQTTVKMLSN